MFVIEELLKKLNTSVVYAHWKSNIALEKALKGKTDLDLLVSKNDSLKFIKIISEIGFKRVEPGLFKGYPSLEHYFCYDTLLDRFVHLHIHYRLIYGYRNIKEYHIPIENFFLEKRKLQKICYIPEPEMEYFLYVLRLFSKFRFSQKMKLKFKKKIVDNELRFLLNKMNFEKFKLLIVEFPIFIEKQVKKAFLRVAEDKKFTGKDIKAITNFNNMFKRKSKFRKIFELFSKKIIWKLTTQPKKHFFSGGFSIAFVGVDGSGKSTMVKKIYKKFNKKFDVSHYYMGGKKDTLSLPNLFFYLIVLTGKIPLKIMKIFYSSKKKGYSLIFTLSTSLNRLIEYIFAKNRLLRFKKGMKDTANGKVVIFERFPLTGSFDYYMFKRDYILREEKKIKKNYFPDFLEKKIKGIYNQIYSPDIMFYMQIKDIHKIKERRPWLSDEAIDKLKIKNKSVVDYFTNNNNKDVIIVDAEMPVEKLISFISKNIWINL